MHFLRNRSAARGPLGTALVFLGSLPILQELHGKRSPGGLQLVFSYLDGLCLAGEQQAVAEAVAYVQSAAAQIGLRVNFEKCEAIPTAGLHSQVRRDLFPSSFAFSAGGDFELLGAPIGSPEYCNQHTQARVDKATKLLAALGELPDPQVALLLLRQCACFGKLVYSLRLVPPSAHRQALRSFDSAVRDCFDSFID